MPAHAPGAISVAVSPNGQWVASGSSDRTVKLWDLRTGEHLCSLEGCHPVVFSPDGKTLVTGSVDHSLEIWRHVA
ncbi:MAG: hypothetical protein HC852_04090 [Acaryochloridaceae cyanobacterium RU_4_10]|nr:hypothetical protein [Acaryochloridaceae cyanobacterium RU_4_10]